MAAWSRKMLKKSFFVFFFRKNDPLRANVQNSVPKGSPPHRSTCCVQVSWNLADAKSVKLCVAFLTKNFAWLSRSHYCADRAKNPPEPAPDNVLRVLQISSISVHFRLSYISERMNTVRMRSKVNPIFSRSLTSSPIKNLVKFVVYRLTGSAWCTDHRKIWHANFPLIGEGVPINVKIQDE